METEEIIKEQKIQKRPVWVSLLLYFVSFLVFMAVYGLVAEGILFLILGKGNQNQLLYYTVMESGMLLAVLTSAFILLPSERRAFSDLGFVFKGHLKGLGYGTLLAFVLYLIGFGISLIFGVVEVTGFQFDPRALLGSLFFYVLVSITEEIMMRGYVLGRLLDTKLNKFLSLLISSILFALLHIFNPNVAFLPMLNLVLAGMLLGASYLYTRNLCFPLALHLFWNWIQGSVLGYQVSGNTFGTSLLTLRLTDNHLLNGGAFGFEGSLICTVLMVVFTILIIWWGEKREAISLAVPRPC